MLYLLDYDRGCADRLALTLAAKGYAVETFGDIAEFESVLLQRPPDAVVVDLNPSEGKLTGTQFASSLERCAKAAIPAIVVSARDDM